MYKIGDNLLYGSNGVMQVVDIREEEACDQLRSYYVLRAATGRSESLVFVPTDNERLSSLMHPLLTREGVNALLGEAIDASVIEWNENSRARTESFKRIIESGDRRKILAMMRSIYESGIRREELGKKNYIADEAIKQKAEKLLSVELSVVLSVTEEEALALIKNKVESEK